MPASDIRARPRTCAVLVAGRVRQRHELPAPLAMERQRGLWPLAIPVVHHFRWLAVVVGFWFCPDVSTAVAADGQHGRF